MLPALSERWSWTFQAKGEGGGGALLRGPAGRGVALSVWSFVFLLARGGKRSNTVSNVGKKKGGGGGGQLIACCPCIIIMLQD